MEMEEAEEDDLGNPAMLPGDESSDDDNGRPAVGGGFAINDDVIRAAIEQKVDLGELPKLDRRMAQSAYDLGQERAAADRLERRRLKSVLFAGTDAAALYEVCRIAAGTAGIEAWGNLWVPDRDAVIQSDHANDFSRSAALYRRHRTDGVADAREGKESSVFFRRNAAYEPPSETFRPFDAMFRRLNRPDRSAAEQAQLRAYPPPGKRVSGMPPTGNWSTFGWDGRKKVSHPEGPYRSLPNGGTLGGLIGHHLPWDEKWKRLVTRVKDKGAGDNILDCEKDDFAFFQTFGDVLSDTMTAAFHTVINEIRRLNNPRVRNLPIRYFLKVEILRAYLGRWIGHQIVSNRVLSGKVWLRREALEELQAGIADCRGFFRNPDLLPDVDLGSLADAVRAAGDDGGGDGDDGGGDGGGDDDGDGDERGDRRRRRGDRGERKDAPPPRPPAPREDPRRRKGGGGGDTVVDLSVDVDGSSDTQADEVEEAPVVDDGDNEEEAEEDSGAAAAAASDSRRTGDFVREAFRFRRLEGPYKDKDLVAAVRQKIKE